MYLPDAYIAYRHARTAYRASLRDNMPTPALWQTMMDNDADALVNAAAAVLRYIPGDTPLTTL